MKKLFLLLTISLFVGCENDEGKSEDEKTAEAYNELAAKLTIKVLDEFASGFIVPWHRWRFEHLKPESVRKLRSEVDI